MRGLHRLFVCLLVSCGSAIQWSSKEEFTVLRGVDMVYRRTADSCSLCSSEDCLTLEENRCNYYMETAKILKETENEADGESDPQTKAEVDAQLFSLMEHASENAIDTECIPLVSHFTDCTKETVCLGCKTCSCDSTGRWNCSIIRQCQANPLTKLDHPTILLVIENLKQLEELHSRTKRSIKESPEKFSSPLISEWLYSVPPLSPEVKIVKEVDPNEDNTETDDSEDEGLKIPREKNEKYLKFISKRPYYNPEGSQKRYIFSGDSNRLKRDVEGKITFEELSDWLNDMQTSNSKNSSTNTESDNEFPRVVSKPIRRSTTVNMATTETPTTAPMTETSNTEQDQILTTTKNDQEIAFDEVLNSIIVDNHNNTRRKPLLDTNHTERIFQHDFMYDDENVTFENSYEVPGAMRLDNKADRAYMSTVQSNEFTTEATTRELTDTFIEGVTEIVIDLLETAKNNDNNTIDIDKDYNFAEKLTKESNYGDENNIEDLDPVNVMKRDIVYALNNSTKVDTNLSDLKNVTESNDNSTKNKSNSSPHKLKETVLQPLFKILMDKNKEIMELIRIKQNLIDFLRDFNETELEFKANYTKSDINSSEDTNNKIVNNFVSFHKLNMPHLHEIEFQNDPNVVNEYVTKLKNDIYEVIKDIFFIQKLYTDPSKMPDDMKYLLRSMTKYVHRKGHQFKGKRYKLIARRFPTSQYNNFDFIKENLIEILKVVERSIPSSNMLRALSPGARKILQRITKQYYVDEFASVGLQISNHKYNISEDLKSIGIQWPELTESIETSNRFNLIYNMKSLHLALSTDINKMKDALAILEFAGGRRAKMLDNSISLDGIKKMNENLKILNKRIQDITIKQIKNKRILYHPKNWPKTEIDKRKKKQSFLKKLKNFLINSKKDILKLLRKKVPKSEVLKELARKKVDTLTSKQLLEYENTMQKWQNNLNIVTVRMKRSLSGYDRMRNRIKNIIPKYLRGKVHPAINAQHSKKRATTVSFS